MPSFLRDPLLKNVAHFTLCRWLETTKTQPHFTITLLIYRDFLGIDNLLEIFF